MLVTLEEPITLNLPRPFWFQLAWIAHLEFTELVNHEWKEDTSLETVIASFTVAAQW